jgi:subtilisin-like proprotein convertase family protein
MKKIALLIFAFEFLVSLPALSAEYFYYYQNRKLSMTPDDGYLTIKFNTGASGYEMNRVYSSVSPFVKEKTEFLAQGNNPVAGPVYILKLKDNLQSGSARMLENTLKGFGDVKKVGRCFRYNDKVLHFITDEVIVRFKKNVSRVDIENLSRLFRTSVVEEIPSFENTFLITIDRDNSDDAFETSNRFALTNFVEFAQPNFIRSGLLLDAPGDKQHEHDRFMPNDTLLPFMWNIKNTGTNIPDGITGIPGCDMNMELAWDVTGGNPNVLISIIDTGIDTNHTDLRDNLCDRREWYDAFDNDQKPYDEYYHGTGVSGTSSAVGNNNIGNAGIAYNCKILPVRVFGPYPQGLSTDLILAKGLNWAWKHGAAVMNCSWGGGIPGSLITMAIQHAVNYGRNGKGSVVFGGAGNADTNIVIYPASMPEVIGVGGLSPCNERKSKVSCDRVGGPNQNWGACYGEGMEIVAPCTYIGTTTLLGGWCICGNGTSVSSPLAAGVAGLMISKNINISGDSVKMIIERTARKVGNYSYNIPRENGMWSIEMGYGTIDAKACLDMTPLGPSTIYDQIPPQLTLYPPESKVFSGPLYVDAVITDNIGIAEGDNAPRLYYRTQRLAQLNVLSGSVIASDRYRFTLPLPAYGDGYYYYVAAQDNVTVPNFVTYPLGGSGVNPPGINAPSKMMFVRNTFFFDTTLASSDVPIRITSERETSFVSIIRPADPSGKTVLDVDVMLNVKHTFDADLTFSLISPSGTEVVLAGGVGWDGNDFINTYFDDEASIAIDSSAVSAPFTGRFRPIDKLWLFDGESSGGVWKLRVIDNGFLDGGALLSWSIKFRFSLGPDQVGLPGEFRLVKNFPNPFNPMTRIVFDVPRHSKVKIVIYDATGSEVRIVINEFREAAMGDFVDFDATGLASGVYFYSLIADDHFIESKKMVFVK